MTCNQNVVCCQLRRELELADVVPMCGRGLGLLALWICLLTCFASPLAAAQENGQIDGEPVSDAAEVISSDERAGTFGLGGHYRVGRWAWIQVENVASGSEIELETLDGDGVRYVSRVQVAEGSNTLEAYLPAGPLGSPVVARTVASEDAAPEVLWRTRLNREESSGGRGWIVAVGETLGIDQIGQNALLDEQGHVDVSLVERACQLPDQWIGYDGVSWIVIGGGSVAALEGIDAARADAMRDWVRGGGRLLVSLGEQGPELFNRLAWLGEALGATESPRAVLAEPAAMETYMSATVRTARFAATDIKAQDALTVLLGTTTGREAIPLIYQRQYGLGAVTVFSGGLHESPLAEWEERADLLSRLIPELVVERRQRGRGGPRADVRYTDMVGQVRGTLDQFEGAGRIRFSVVAAILLCLVGFLGPIDFLLVNRWLGRPLLGWLSFPISVAALSAGILLWRGATPAASGRQITVVDIDSITGQGRGLSWIQVFSGDARRFSAEAMTTGDLAGAKDEATLVTPWGFAGKAFGGIEVVGEDTRLPGYEMLGVAGGDRGLASRLKGVPLAPLSSKSLAARWQFLSEVETPPALAKRLGGDMLAGQLSNPLPVDLLDGFLVYRNLIYVLPTRVPAGGIALNLDASQPKNFRWRLNRRRSGESASQSEPWDPADTSDLGRLMEVLLFYEAAGGEKYTGLSNDVLNQWDLSHVLGAERAILVGRLASPPVAVNVSEMEGEAGGWSLDESDDSRMTYARVLLPVQQ